MEKYTNMYMYKNNGENGSIKCNNHILTSQPYILIPKISTSRKFGNEWAFDTNIKFKLTTIKTYQLKQEDTTSQLNWRKTA